MQCFILRGQTWSVPIVVACAWLGLPAIVLAQPDNLDQSVIPFTEIASKDSGIGAKIQKPGDSSRRQRLAAAKELPVTGVSAAAQGQIQDVLNNISLFRRLPTVSMVTDQRPYEYFLQHPDVAVSLWRAMEISQVQLSQAGPTSYRTDTRDGTVGTVELLYRNQESVLILCQGQLHAPGMPRPIQAKALIHLQYRVTGPTEVVHYCDMFVSFPSAAVEAIAKLVSPMSFRVADKNFEEISLFVSLMSNAMMKQPGWVEQIALQMEGVAAERGNELRSITASVYVDSERRRLQSQGRPVSLEAMRPPVADNPGVVPASRVVR
ncbi:MAG TPA: hypothetical protein VNQ76_05735 [Planctomicrobium sp.]|nr:hypothetical protein [Planctomicrobium sp.]